MSRRHQPAPKVKYARLALCLGLIALLAGVLARGVVVSAQGGSPGTLSFSQAEYDVSEGVGNANITLSRTGGTDGAVTAKVSLTDVTTSPADYRFAPGALATFNSGLGPNNMVRVVTQQPDGKIIIGGSFSSYDNAPRNGVARLSADGVLDPTFVPPATAGSDVFSLALQPDGKLLVGDIKTKGIERLNADGTIDTSFNPGAGSGTFAVEYMALQPDGKVLVGGNFSSFNGVTRNSIARLNADGSLDATFDSGAGAPGGSLGALLLQPDGKVLAGGVFTSFGGVARSHIARINSDGSIDTSFDPGASVGGFIVEALALEPDGKIIAGGAFPVGATFNGANPTSIVRLNTDGSRDTSFADPGLGAKFRTITIARQPDGKLVVGGTILPDVIGGQIFHSLARLNADGSNDTTFSSGIRAFSNSTLNSLDLQPDGKILVGGQFSLHPFGAPFSYLMRLEGDLFVTWGAGDAADKSITLPVVDDALSEDDETLNLTLTPLTGGASAGATPSATLKILDNDGQLQFASATFSAAEGAGSVAIPVTRAGGTSVTTTISYSITGGSATPGVDFTASSGTLTFAPGETSKNIPVTLLDDQVNERDETVALSLGTVTNGLLGTPSQAVLTILNDDPLPTISVDDVTVTEGDAGTKQAAFIVTRTGLIDRAVTFTARTSDDTALAQEDYLPVSGQFQIGPGVSSATIPVSIIGDTIIEPDKSFTLSLSSPTNATIARAQAACTIKDNDFNIGPPTVQFARRTFSASEGDGLATVTVTRSGDASAPATVGYSTNTPSSQGVASDRSDYTTAFGTLRFAAGETTKTFTVFITDDALVEGDEFFAVILFSPTGGAALGLPSASLVKIVDNDTAPSTSNPADDTTFFVRQHYRDFLGRDPDAAGLQFWTQNIESCGSDADCRAVKRVNVSAAFFLSIEFQNTGYLVYRLYKTAYNTGERLSFRTFLSDSQEIGQGVVVGSEGWEQKLEANKAAFLDEFVARQSFTTQYPQSLTPAQFVDALNAFTGDPLNPTAGGSLTQAERDQLVADLTSGAKSRAQVLRAVAENAEFQRRQTNKAFVYMQYVGYLRRGPSDAPDVDFTGYNFWLSKLNQFNGNFVKAEMVKAFITSTEYRQRFGTP